MWASFIDALKNPHKNWFLAGLLVINILGSVYGYYWYRHQLTANALCYWPVIPDSPRSTTFFALVMVLLLLHNRGLLRRFFWFEAVAYTGVVKYGIWAVVMITQAWFWGDSQNWTDWMLWWSHLGMAAQGLIFLRHLSVNAAAIIVPALWMFFNDWVDYAYGFHPYLFSSDQVFYGMITAVALSCMLLLVLLGLVLLKK